MDFVRAAFPDFTNSIEDIISERDKAFTRLTYTGTHKGEIFGVAPTHRKISHAGASVFYLMVTRSARSGCLAMFMGCSANWNGRTASNHKETAIAEDRRRSPNRLGRLHQSNPVRLQYPLAIPTCHVLGAQTVPGLAAHLHGLQLI
jgi:SnoaL-like polyketide cyclase